MNATRYVRKVDELGRVVLPVEIRRILGIQEFDRVEVYVEGEHIIVEKYRPKCVVCGIYPGSIKYSDSLVCTICIEDLRALNSKSTTGDVGP